MSVKLPFVSKRVIVPGIIDLAQLNYEDLEEIVAGGQGSFHIGNASGYIHTYALRLRHCFYCLCHTSF